MQAFDVGTDEVKKSLRRQIDEHNQELANCRSEIVHDIKKVKEDMTHIMVAIREENKNIQGDVDHIKGIVQKIYQIVVDIRYKVCLFDIKCLHLIHTFFLFRKVLNLLKQPIKLF